MAGCWVFPAAPAVSNTAATTLLFLAAAAVARRSTVPRRYQWSIVAGLGFSALGDAFLMQTTDWFTAGLGSFLAAHLCYLAALTSDHPPLRRKLPFIVWGAFGVVFISSLWRGIPGPQRVPVLLYTTVLLTMAGQAASRALELHDRAAIAAALGAALFVVSDSVLAFQRFRHSLEGGRFIVLGTYFAAQGGIALSVELYARTREHRAEQRTVSPG